VPTRSPNLATEIHEVCGYPGLIKIEPNEVANGRDAGIAVGFGWTTELNGIRNNEIDRPCRGE